MARGRIRKTNKGAFSEEAMTAAVNLVLQERMPLRQAAERTGVKYQTLFRYVRKQKSAGDNVRVRMTPKYNSRRIFNEEQEETIAQYAIECAKMCYGKSRKDIRVLAYELAVANVVTIPPTWQQNKKAGMEWLHGFMARHPTLSIRQPEGCSLARATSFNRHNVALFYKNLETIYNRTEAFTNGTRVFNLDETATTTVQKPRKIVAKKGSKQVSSATSGERGILVTTCCIISANGNFLPPVMVFPRKKFKEHMLHGAPPGTLGLATSSGWMTVDLFVAVIKHFIHYTSSSIENPSLLIMDNHESHLSAYVLEIAKTNGVTILTLPPHCSHKLQPLDVAVFFPFKNFYNAAMESWLLRHPGRPITIYDIAECVGTAFQRAMTPANISSGFQKTGIFPFDKHIFTDDYACSSVTDRENEGMENVAPTPDISNLAEVVENDNQGTSANSIEKQTGSSNLAEVVENDKQETTANSMENQTDSSNLREVEMDHGETCVAPAMDATVSSDRKTFISPQILKGYPKADNLKRKTRSRNKKSIIATDTPEKNAIEAKALEKERKALVSTRQKQGRATGKRKLVESSSDDDDDANVIFDDNSSDDVDFLDTGFDTFPELEESPIVGNFVLVQFNKTVFYVAKIIKDKDANGDYEVSYLRKSVKCSKSFVFPPEQDIALVPENDIKVILAQHIFVGQTKRQQRFYKFEINFGTLDVR